MQPETGDLIDLKGDEGERDLEADHIGHVHPDCDCDVIAPDVMRTKMRKLHQPNPCEQEKSVPHLFEMLDDMESNHAVYRYHIDFFARTARAYAWCEGDYEEPTTVTIRLPELGDDDYIGEYFNEEKVRSAVTDYTKAYRKYSYQKALSEEKMPRMAWSEFVKRAVVDGGVQEIIVFVSGYRTYYIGGTGELVVAFSPGADPCEHYKRYDDDGNVHFIERKEDLISIASQAWTFVSNNFFFWRYL